MKSGGKARRGPRRLGRELAMKLLYQFEVAGKDMDAAEENFMEFKRAPERARDFARELARGVGKERGELDGKIKEALKKWKFDRLSLVDLQLMRIALHEMLHSGDVPANVAIDEAIDLSRVYSGEKAAKFVNGVLGTLALRYAPARNEKNRDR